MTDIFDAKKRSEVMSRIRGKGNKSTELALVAAFRRAGINGWRRHVVIKVRSKAKQGLVSELQPKVLVIKPDFVFKKERVAVFVDGCFWHRCALHSKLPKSNSEFWEQKLARNVERDRLANLALKGVDWQVLRIWEHDLVTDIATVIAAVRHSLRGFS